jgi:hypothetical protein
LFIVKFPEFLGTTSKETVETGSYGKNCVWSNSPNFWVDPHIFNGHFPLLLKGDFKYGTVENPLYIPKPALCLVIKSMDPFYTESEIGFETLKPFLFNKRYYKLLIA